MFQRFVTGALCAAVLTVMAAPGFSQGNPIQGAKGAVAALGRAKGLQGMADGLTNESAGTIGLLLSLPLKMMMGMAEGAMKMAPDGAKSAKPDPKAQAELTKMKGAVKQIDGVLAKYGADSSKPMAMMDSKKKFVMPPRMKAQGRTMMVEIGTILEKASKDTTKSLNGNSVPKPETLTYKVLSPTRVAITDPKKPKDKLESRYEDGKWRIHISPEMMRGGNSTP